MELERKVCNVINGCVFENPMGQFENTEENSVTCQLNSQYKNWNLSFLTFYRLDGLQTLECYKFLITGHVKHSHFHTCHNIG